MTVHSRLLAAALLLSILLLAGCTRGGSDGAATPDPSAIAFVTFTPDPAAPTIDPALGEPTLAPAAPIPVDPAQQPPPVDPAQQPAPTLPPAAPIGTGRLSGLRFGSTGNGPEAAIFPRNTEEVCAIFEYRDMTAADVIRRVWVLNEAVYVERQEPWPLDRYGPAGTVRDVCLFDRLDSYIDGAVDGIDPGTWRVELYLNGALESSAQFTVGP